MKINPVFKSRRFTAAVISLLIMVLVAYVPQLQVVEDRLVQAIVDVISALL